LKKLLFLILYLPCLWGDLSVGFDEALDLAMKQNQSLLSLKQLVEEAKAGKIVSMASWLPQISAMTSYFRNSEQQLIALSKNTFLTQISLTQNVFNADAWYDVKIADLEYQKLQLLYDALVNEMTYLAKTAYFKVVLDLEKLETQEEHVRLLSALLKKMQDRLKIGEAIALNVNQSQVALSNAKSRYYQSLKALKDSRSELAVLIGLDPEAFKVDVPEKRLDVRRFDYLEEKFIKTKRQEETPEIFSAHENMALEQLAKQYNPNLKTTRIVFEMMNQEVRRSVGKYFPEVQLVANYGGGPNPFLFYPSSNFNNQSMQLGIGVQLTWNLFDGLRREGNVQRARSRRSSSFHELENTAQHVSLALSESITGIEESLSQVIWTEDNVGLAELTKNLAYDQLEIGYITIYDYQISLDQLVQAKNLLSESKYSLLKNYFSLEKVVGKCLSLSESAHE